MIPKYNVISDYWFNVDALDPTYPMIGIVLIQDPIGYRVAYIGLGYGRSVDYDQQRIAAYGNKLDYKHASAFFDIPQNQYKEDAGGTFKRVASEESQGEQHEFTNH